MVDYLRSSEWRGFSLRSRMYIFHQRTYMQAFSCRKGCVRGGLPSCQNPVNIAFTPSESQPLASAFVESILTLPGVKHNSLLIKTRSSAFPTFIPPDSNILRPCAAAKTLADLPRRSRVRQVLPLNSTAPLFSGRGVSDASTTNWSKQGGFAMGRRVECHDALPKA